jgi:hypothetical protein
MRDVEVGTAGPIRVLLANSPTGMRIALSGDRPTKMLTVEEVEDLIRLLHDAVIRVRAG